MPLHGREPSPAFLRGKQQLIELPRLLAKRVKHDGTDHREQGANAQPDRDDENRDPAHLARHQVFSEGADEQPNGEDEEHERDDPEKGQ